MLGVPVSQLKKIKLHHQKDSDRCKLELLQYWLDNNSAPMWNVIVQALKETDQLALADQIKHDYLCLSTNKAITSDEIKVEIKADVALVSNLRELEKSLGLMLVQVKRLLVLNKCDLSDAQLFLDSVIGTEDFTRCDTFNKLIRQLQQDHIDVFNISILQRLVAFFDNHELTAVVEVYNEKKESFLKHTAVLEFQRAVVSRVEPILASGNVVPVTIKTSKEIASLQTLKDIEILAIEGFEESHKKFVRVHAEPG